MRSILSKALILIAVWVFPLAAWADDAESGAIAERLFRKGQVKIEAGKIEEACNDFAASLQLERAIGTLRHEQQGKSATAWNEYAEVIAIASRTGQKDRESFAKERTKALDANSIRRSGKHLDVAAAVLYGAGAAAVISGVWP